MGLAVNGNRSRHVVPGLAIDSIIVCHIAPRLATGSTGGCALAGFYHSDMRNEQTAMFDIDMPAIDELCSVRPANRWLPASVHAVFGASWC
jgi:hypothetical protein